jgi:hypothetical protein
MALRDAEIDVEQRRHRRAAVGVDRELAARDALLLAACVDELLRDRGRLARRDLPAGDVAAEDIQDDVQRAVSRSRRTNTGRSSFVGSMWARTEQAAAASAGRAARLMVAAGTCRAERRGRDRQSS